MSNNEVNYAKIARGDLWMASTAIKFGTDDVHVNMAAYHCQQAVEKAIKILYFKNKLPLLRSHKIRLLLDSLEERGVDISLFDEIKLNSETITSWADDSRYMIDPLTSKKHIDQVIKIISDILDKMEASFIKVDNIEIKKDYKSDKLNKIK